LQNKHNRLGGNPETLIRALSEQEAASDLTIVSLTGGTDGKGIGILLEAPGKVKRLVSSYVGENKFLERQFFAGHLQVELVPQGTIAQRLQAAGAGTYTCVRACCYSMLFSLLAYVKYVFDPMMMMMHPHFFLMREKTTICLRNNRYSSILHTHWGWDHLRKGRHSDSVQK
jgi:Coenzyme A transferase